MKKLFGLFLILLCLSGYTQATDNAIKMGYNFVTVSQTVVFDNTMRAGGTLALSALIADGGGRNPGDPITMKLVFYNSSNAIINTTQQAYTMVLGAAPTSYSVSSTNCGGSCANVAYVSVQFYGKDGGYWAGNYGPYIQSPSLKLNGGSNILYNPEFGVYGTNGYAQGWTSSNGWQSCALYSGAQTCVVNNGAPVNGGNYSVTGGTTSGTSGGYTAAPPVTVVTITTTQQAQIAAARARQTLSNQINIDQIGSYNNTDVIQSGTYHLVDVNIGGDSNDIGINQLGVKNYSKVLVTGSNNTANVYQSNSGGAAVTGHFSAATVIGNTNSVNVSQTGDGEKQSFVLIDGSSNSVTNNQLGTGSKYADIKATGNGHTVVLDQKDGGSHAARIEVTNNGGASNINVLQQGNTTQYYLLQQSCATVGGCSVTITQQ